MAIAARELGLKGIFLPAENAIEAAVVDGIPIFPVKTLSQVISALKGAVKVSPLRAEINHFFEPTVFQVDFMDVRGQEHAKRALEIAAAGKHNVIMIGPPGSVRPCWPSASPLFCRPCGLRNLLKRQRFTV